MSEAATPALNEDDYSYYSKRIRIGLTITSSISLFSTVLCVLTFVVLYSSNARRIDIPLVKITMTIQAVNTLSLVVIIVFNAVTITSELLCAIMRYSLFICYLCTMFMSTAITIHLWLVISRRHLDQATRGKRWYYIIPFSLAFTLAAILGIMPSKAYGFDNRCLGAIIPNTNYLIIKWALYYGWFVASFIISVVCMINILLSARRLTHTTDTRRGSAINSTEAYRNEVNARANSKRLRSLVVYTIVFPVISFASNFLQLFEEMLSGILKREIDWLVFMSRFMLYSEGFFLSLAFFCYPAVRHSFRDITRSSIQYWVCEQEEYWHTLKAERKLQRTGASINRPATISMDERDIKNFSSLRGQLYHFLLKRTPEGRLLSNL